MQKIACCIFILFSFIQATGQTTAQEIDELLKAYSNQNSFNGSALIAQKGTILLEKGYGYRNALINTLNDSNTIFQIASLTKQFTSALILQLQEQGMLLVHNKLSKYIPDYPNGDSITIENLLTHTSGIHNFNDEAFMKNNATKPMKLESIIALFKNAPPDFKSGTNYNYSNSNYILLGFIIEKITGKSYYQNIWERILQPLQMNHSGFDFASLKSTDKATGYSKLNAKNKKPAQILDSSILYAAGGMYSTVRDLYKWDKALYTDKIIHNSSRQKAFTSFKNNYGYGWLIDSAYNKKAVLHEGATPGFTSFIGRILDDSTCIILLDNKQSTGLLKIAEDVNAILNHQPYDFPKPRTEIEVDSAILKEYTGDYQLSPELILTIALEDGQLTASAKSQGKAELFAEKENFFFVKMTDVQIEFTKNALGKVTKLIFYQNGQQLQALKIK
ncbi:MAG TPA: serine hydrolase [Puia sp.]|nr:serine hydrolase [Puia sp.]